MISVMIDFPDTFIKLMEVYIVICILSAICNWIKFIYDVVVEWRKPSPPPEGNANP